MAKGKAKTKSSGDKKPIHILRERHGGMSDEMKAYYKDITKSRKALKDALKQGPGTVPELASRSGLTSADVMWHVMAMKKYGDVCEGELKGDYYTYSLAGKE